MSWPGKILPNTKVEEKVSHLDVRLLDNDLSEVTDRIITGRRLNMTLLLFSSLRLFWTMPKLVNMIFPMEKAFDPLSNGMKRM
jgi:hypothetical protein